MPKPINSSGKGNGGGGGKGGGHTKTDAGNQIFGTDGNDTLVGTDGADSIFGGGGDDIIISGMGDDFLDGQDGSDTYVVGFGEGINTYSDSGAGAGDYDVILASDNYTNITMTTFGPDSGIEEINGNGHFGVNVAGTGGDDVLDLSATVLTDINAIAGYAGNDTLIGSQGNDQIYGGSGDDTLVGNAGNDTLVGSAGADTMTGGDGSDTFVFLRSGDAGDVVTDFQTGTGGDVLDLSELVSFENATVSLLQSGGDAVVVVTQADGSTVDLATLNNVDASTWDDSNWIL